MSSSPGPDPPTARGLSFHDESIDAAAHRGVLRSADLTGRVDHPSCDVVEQTIDGQLARVDDLLRAFERLD